MSNVYDYMWLIPVLPALGAVIIALFGPRFLKNQSHWPCVLAAGASAALSFGVFAAVNGDGLPKVGGKPDHSHSYGTWFEVGPLEAPVRPQSRAERPVQVDVEFSLRADGLSAIMLVTVTFIGTLIAIFAIGYMHGDPGYPRFFAAVSLFIAAMTLLVSGNNFLILFAGWEGVGVCSYLLIGFWFSKPSAAVAARKAFLVNRIGDFGFILGILLLWVSSGYYLDYDHVFEVNAGTNRLAWPINDEGLFTLICVLLFCGAAGKSAQIPLHVWLPDAMEGPTPVSALIHAATMVTAGVYMVARCTPLFQEAPTAQLMVGGIGGFTALFAALIALTQNDLKRVLAYSTLSQLGYMFLALGCAIGPKGGAGGEHSLVAFAVSAAIFHLFTHAFFKALLFLSAGSVMHAMGGIDMRRFSGLRKVLPITHVTFLVGALTLAGFPLLSGFWSKDEILLSAFDASQRSSSYGAIYGLLFFFALFTAGLTAFYTFRAYFMTFWGELKLPPEAGQHGHAAHDTGHGHGHDAGHGHAPAETHAHGPVDPTKLESPPVMTIPLIILAVFALGIGAVVGPTHLFAGWLERPKTPFFPKLEEQEVNIGVMGGSIVFGLTGIAVAWFMYVKRPEFPGKLAAAIQGLYQLSLNKFFVDEIYGGMVARVQGFAEFCRTFDQGVVDGLVDLTGEVPRLFGSLFRPVQNGLLQFYALAMMLGLTVFLIALASKL
jgi:NADH-quinone oxidoreductase subunit L